MVGLLFKNFLGKNRISVLEGSLVKKFSGGKNRISFLGNGFSKKYFLKILA
jgi:hypothetical protein